MKVVILAGGKGTRLQEETSIKPKPLIEIGSKPLIWHIMKLYSSHGFNEFVICCGHKGYMIKEYFKNFSPKFYNKTILFLWTTSSPYLYSSISNILSDLIPLIFSKSWKE